tara:strand:- start:639 stop:4532 length:3894 start_codon:yes stop_codon:yes gene_type:complete
MATMRWQKVSLPINQGVDTKTDEKALPPAKLANLENGVFTKAGSIVKRNGYTELSDDVINLSSTPTSVRGLHAVNNELVLTDDERIFSYASETDQWSNRGRFKSLDINTEVVEDTDALQVGADCATVRNITVYAWEDSRGGVYISAVNEETGATCLSATQVDASGARPRVAAVGSFIHVYFAVSSSFKQLVISPSNIEKLVSTGPASLYTELASDMHGDQKYDICTDEESVYIAYYTTHGSNKLKVVRRKAAGGALADQDYAINLDKCLTIAKEPNTGKVFVAWHYHTDADTKAYELNGVDLSVLKTHTIEDNLTGVRNMTAAFRGVSSARPNLYALDLEATSSAQYAYLGTNTKGDTLDLREDITIEAWIKFESLPTSSGSMEIVARDGNATDQKGYYFRFTDAATDKLQYATRDSSGNYITAETNWNAPATDTWFHVAVSHDKSAGKVQFYVDGSAQGSEISGLNTTTAESSEAKFSIGCKIASDGTISNNFDGMISEVRVWDSLLHPSVIAANDMTEIAAQTNLVGYWRLNNSYEDTSGNEQTLTPGGATAYTLPQFVYAYGAGLTVGKTSTFAALETETLSDNYQAVLFYEVQDAANIYWKNIVRKAAVTLSGDITAGADFKLHCGLSSHAWAEQGDVHVNVNMDTTLQTTFFTYMDDGTLIAKMEPGVAYGTITTGILPGVQDLGDRLFQWTGGYRKRLDSEESTTTSGSEYEGVDATTDGTANAVYTAPGIKRFRMNFNAEQSHQAVQVGRTSYLSGGMLWQYDGSVAVESGFHVYPEKFTVAVSAGTGLTASRYYFYRVYAVWTNANGETERSACPASISQMMPGSTNLECTLTIPTISHTNKLASNGVAPIHFEVYRTTADPLANSPFYKVSSDDPTDTTGENRYVTNDQTTQTVTFVDELADTVIIAKEIDYQNSGELDNIAPPSASIIAEGKDRIWLAGFENASEVQYSKQHFAGKPVEFNDALRLTIPESGGAITGLRVMSNNLVIFKKRSIYVLPGDGPNNLGFGRFGAAQLVSNDVGCKDQRSLVDTPLGIMFQSEKGIYVLSKGYQVAYVGAAVEGYNSQTVTDAILIGNKNHVAFLTASGRTLLFDYLFQQWSTFTNHEGTSAAFWNNSFCYGRGTGKVYRESTTTFTDAGSPIKLKIETAWIKMDTLQGFHRVRRAMVLGEFKSSHRLAMDISYDYEPLRRRLIFDADAKMETTTFGDPADPSEFGDGTPFGSGTTTSEMESNVYQFKAHLPVQKCQSIKFYFEDIEAVGKALAEGYEITELMLEVGMKRGAFKVADTRSI